ncbi:MAG: T9SS type A sorting domain-containing protein [Bacteroidota bacterium]
MKYTFLSILLLLSLWNPLLGQTTVSSNITTNTTWTTAGSPYTLTNPITVQSGVTLTINPGVIVYADTAGWTIEGNLVALGNPMDSIYILPNGGDGLDIDWNGMFVTGSGTVQMEYVRSYRALYGLRFLGSSNSAGSYLYRCYFEQHYAGVENLNGTAPTLSIDSCTFRRNKFSIQGQKMDLLAGVFIEQFYTPSLSNTNLTNCTWLDPCNHAFKISSGKVNSCNFVYSPTPWCGNFAVELVLQGPDSLIFVNNLIETAYGIDVSGSASAPYRIQHNTICTPIDSFLVKNGTGQSINLEHNCWCSADSAHIANYMRNDNGVPTNTISFYPFDTTCVPAPPYESPVMPGDADHDQLVHNVDLLALGLFYGDTGPTRANASLNWQPQPASAWGDTLQSTLADSKHADTDGNGVINMDDTLAIDQNYGLVHTFNKTGGNGGIPIGILPPPGQFLAGDTLPLLVYFGVPDTQAVNVYGASFSLQYDTTFLNSQSLNVRIDSSFFGKKNQDMLSMVRHHPQNGRIDFAFTRIDQMNVSGYGRIAEIIVVIDDDIFKKAQPLEFSIISPYVIDKDEAIFAISPGAAVVTVNEGSTPIDEPWMRSLEIYPNPSQGRLNLESPEAPLEGLSLYAVDGKKLYDQSLNQRRMQEVSLPAHLPNGFYLLQVETRLGMIWKKIQLDR